MIPTFIRSYEASAAVAPYRLVRFSDAANTNRVAASNAATAAHFGASGQLGADAGQMLDVYMGGLCSVQLGGTVQAGQPLTSDANGKAVAASASAGTTVRIVGYADKPGVADDIIDFIWAPGLLHQGA